MTRFLTAGTIPALTHTHRRKALLIFTALSGLTVTVPTWADADATADAAANAGIEPVSTVVVVTGSRKATTEFKSASPVSVVTSQALQATGQPDLRTSLSAVAPAFLASNASNGHSSSKPIRAAALRGLGGNHVLVLVNGRRRHNTSLLNNTGGSAGAPVDLSLIASSSVARVEVLSDGASAQYGSDAIGGVINIILKKAPEGGSFEIQSGAYNSDVADQGGISDSGRTTTASYNQGFAIGDNGGFLNLSAEYRRVLTSNIVGPIGAPTTSVRQIFALPNDPRETSESRYRQLTEVAPWGYTANLAANLELPLNNGNVFYASATHSGSALASSGTYRSENNPAHILGIAPDGGYLPVLTTRQKDYQVVAGFNGDDFLGWRWDASLSYGKNEATLRVNGINASLGNAAEYKIFNVGALEVSEAIANLDLQRSYDTGLFAEPLDVAFGLEYRYNDFTESPGEPDSYANGGYIYPSDYASATLRNRPAGSGSPFMSGFTPQDSGSWDRNSQAVYLDLSQYVTSRLRLGLATRYENFSDSGSSVSGKLSARYEVTDTFAIRGSVNNGFRAPSLAEQYTSVANQGPFNTGTQIIQVNAYNSLRYDAPAAKALGATPLKPEKSLNYSLGFIARPFENLSISVDAFQIEIEDRIGLTGQFNGTATTPAGQAVAAALIAAGVDPNVRVQYFTNIGDTRTNGVELKINYTSDFGRYGVVNWSLASANNRQKVTRATEAPPALSAAGLVLLQTSARILLESGTPREITRAGIDWENGPFNVRWTTTHYSGTRTAHASFPDDRRYDSVARPAYISDLAVTYRINDRIRLTAGANNLFNKRADELPDIAIPLITTGYVNPAPVAAAYGTGGRFSYVRLGVNW